MFELDIADIDQLQTSVGCISAQQIYLCHIFTKMQITTI